MNDTLVHPWLLAFRGLVAAVGVVFLALGAVLYTWPRPGALVAFVFGAALLLLALETHLRIARDLRKKLELGP
jgi:hypothetical protein